MKSHGCCMQTKAWIERGCRLVVSPLYRRFKRCVTSRFLKTIECAVDFVYSNSFVHLMNITVFSYYKLLEPDINGQTFLELKIFQKKNGACGVDIQSCDSMIFVKRLEMLLVFFPENIILFYISGAGNFSKKVPLLLQLIFSHLSSRPYFEKKWKPKITRLGVPGRKGKSGDT